METTTKTAFEKATDKAAIYAYFSKYKIDAELPLISKDITVIINHGNSLCKRMK